MSTAPTPPERHCDGLTRHCERADELEADRDVALTNLQTVRAHSLSVQHDYHHALTAVYAMQRVRRLRDRWLGYTLEPGQVRRLLNELHTAIGTREPCRGRGNCRWMDQTTEYDPHASIVETDMRHERAMDAARAVLGRTETEPDTVNTPGQPARTTDDDRPDMGCITWTPIPADKNGHALTSQDSVRTTGTGNPDTTQKGVRAPVLGGRRDRARTAIADAFDVPTGLIGDTRCSCGQTSPLVLVGPDGSHCHMDPAEHEKLQRGRDDLHPATHAWGNCWDRAENIRQRLALARQVLVDDGYFTDAEVGDDLAPRLVEWLAHHRGQIAELTRAFALALAERDRRCDCGTAHSTDEENSLDDD